MAEVPWIDVGMTAGAIFLLLFLSGFFSGSETALTAASRPRMHKLAQDGDARAAVVDRLIGDREGLIGALLIGNNLVNILASALATSLFIKLLGPYGVASATALMTLLVLIFAEVMPKTYAILNADATAMGVGRFVLPIVRILKPGVIAVQWLVSGIFRLFRLDVDGRMSDEAAHEEIRGAIDLHHAQGAVVKDARDMLGGILDLGDIFVEDAMVHRKAMIMVDAGRPTEEIVHAVLSSPYTRIPLWKDEPENIVGVLHAKDLLRALGEVGWDMGQLDVIAVASEPWFVPETTSLRRQLNAFLKQHSHFALVVDEYGVLMGLITLEDILEEIVGDISDEHDVKVEGVRPQSDGSVNVDGTVPIRDLNRAMDWNLPDEEAVTVAGLIIHEAQVIPEVSQIFTFYGFKFEILRRQRNQITGVRVSPPEEPVGAEVVPAKSAEDAGAS